MGDENSICTFRNKSRIYSMHERVFLLHIESDCKRNIREDNVVINPVGGTTHLITEERVGN